MGCHSSRQSDEKFDINLKNSLTKNTNLIKTSAENDPNCKKDLVQVLKENCSENGKILSEKDIKLVRSSWKDLSKLGDFKTHGINMMVRIFTNHSEIKYIWKFAANLESIDEMRASAQLRSHGNNVFEAINAAVHSLDNLEASNVSLNELGGKHISYGVKAEFFPIMIGAFMETIAEALGSNFTIEHKNAWKKCFDFFIHQMEKGMIDQ